VSQREPQTIRGSAVEHLLDRVADGFVTIDRSWRYTYFNRSAARMLGRRAEDMIGAHVWTEFPAAADAFKAVLEDALASQQQLFVEDYIAAWDRWFEIRVYPSEAGLSVFFSDVSERKRAEAERARLLESETRARGEAEAALARLRAIQAITDSALVQLSLDELLHELLSRLRQVLRADRASLALVDEEGTSLFTRAIDGYPFDAVAAVRVPIGKAVTGRVAAEDRALIVSDYSTVDLTGVEGMPPADAIPPTNAVAGAPLHIGKRVIGVVTVATNLPRRFTEEDLELLMLVADRVAPAIERARLVEATQAAHERLGALSGRLLRAQEEERRRVAGELHDELGQVLTAVKINLESLRRLPAGSPASPLLGDAISSVDQAMQKVRDIALDLRPSVLDDLGLPAALRWYLDRLARDAQVEAQLSIDAVPHLGSELETACFRVAQEALTNIARHSRARHVWLDLHLLAEDLELRVRDDGIGFDVEAARARATAGASMGLLGMEERVTLMGGTLQLLAAPGAGVEVRARFPAGKREISSPG
jgi:PAS domain S-box-containing protein